MSNWNGLCAAGLHGLDHEKQPCDLCEAMNARTAAQLAQSVAPKLTERAYCAACHECGADPLQSCCADNGRTCKPHGKRVARSNGLRHTPRRGFFVKPPEGIQFSEAELAAFRALGHKIPR